MAPPACAFTTHYSASWPPRELHRRPQWDHPQASPSPITARLITRCVTHRMRHSQRAFTTTYG
eukprot:2103909-Pyramimonas_sp.AAC.1